MRVLVCGSRAWTDDSRRRVVKRLWSLLTAGDVLGLITFSTMTRP